MHTPKSVVFPWFDEHFLEAQHPAPALVAARAMCLMEDLQATAQEVDMDRDAEKTWITMGLAGVAKSADPDAFGTLLTGLETLIPYERRRRWPLHSLIARQMSPELEAQIREVTDA